LKLQFNAEIVGTFNHGIQRAKAMIDIQHQIESFLSDEFDVDEWAENIFNSDVINRVLDKKLKKIISELKKPSHKRVTTNDEKQFKIIMKPFLSFFTNFDTIFETPLYPEALIVSVTAFEVYHKQTIINLISQNDFLIKYFSEELTKIDKTKGKPKYKNINEKELPGHLIVDFYHKYSFDDIQKQYQRIFGGDFKLLKDDNEIKTFKEYFLIRNLAVHNKCQIDSDFINRTNKKLTIGEKFIVKKEFVDEGITILEKIVDNIEIGIKNTEF